MKRILISFAGMTLLVSSSFAMTGTDGNNMMGGNDMQNKYKTIQLETDNGLQAHGVISKEEADKLKNHTAGDKVKLHIKDDNGNNNLGQETKDTTYPNGVEQPVVQ